MREMWGDVSSRPDIATVLQRRLPPGANVTTLRELIADLDKSGDVTAAGKEKLMAYANRRPASEVYADAVLMVRIQRKQNRPLPAARKAALEKYRGEVESVETLRNEIRRPSPSTRRAIGKQSSV